MNKKTIVIGVLPLPNNDWGRSAQFFRCAYQSVILFGERVGCQCRQVFESFIRLLSRKHINASERLAGIASLRRLRGNVFGADLGMDRCPKFGLRRFVAPQVKR